MTEQIEVFVPRQPGKLPILPHSGIVGTAQAAGMVLIDYEGNRYQAANIVSFADRVHHAWGRHSTSYPTVARACIPAEELIAVGSYDPLRGDVQLYGPEERQALCAWLEVEQLDEQELRSTGVKHQARREIEQALASPDPRRKLVAREMARRLQIEL